MPTFNRRTVVPGTIDCFRTQTYAHRELVILDDGTDHRSIRAGSLSAPLSTGWNTAERRRVVSGLRRFHRTLHATTTTAGDPTAVTRRSDPE